MIHDKLKEGNSAYQKDRRLRKISRLTTALNYSNGHRIQILRPWEMKMKIKDIEKYAKDLMDNVPNDAGVLHVLINFHKTKVLLPIEKKGKKADLLVKKAKIELMQVEAQKIEDLADMDKHLEGLLVEAIQKHADKFNQSLDGYQEDSSEPEDTESN